MHRQRTSRLRRATITGVALLALALTTTSALAAPGDLDPSFDGDGIRTFDYGGYDFFSGVLLQPQGKIVLTGSGNPGQDFTVTRLNRDGSTDPSFDYDGTIAWDFLGTTDVAGAAAQHADGRIVMAGNTYLTGPRATTAVLQLMSDGSPDYGFGSVGRVTPDYGGNNVARDVLVQPDGKIVLAGYGNSSTSFLVSRLNPDGSPDATFDGDGNVSLNFTDYGSAVALQADGKIVAAAQTSVGAEEDLVVVRLNADGSLDTSWAGDGSRTIDNAPTESASELLVQPNGRIVVAGSVGPDIGVTRLNPDGSTDPGFGGDGTVTLDFSEIDQAYAAVLQANGKIVVAGANGVNPINGATDAAVIARLQPGGALDTSFSGDGKQTFKVGSSSSVSALVLQDNGRMVLAGGATEAGNKTALVARMDGESPAAGGGPASPPGSGPGGGGPGGGGPGRSVPRCNGKRATIVGSNRADRLKGTRRADVIVALGGNDRISAGRGNDTICAGTGKDTIAGGPGNDLLDGGTGNDRLTGQTGKDTLLGRSGRDQLNGGPGRDKQRP